MEWGELVTKYGPLALGWVGFAYVGKFVLDRYQADIDAKVKLALALEALTTYLKEREKA